MPRRKTRRSKGQGSIIKRKDRDNRLVAVVRYTDEFGKKRVVKRYVTSRTEGDLFIKKTLREVEQHGAGIIDADRLTFSKLATIYADRRLTEPVYDGETKVSGLRSHHIQKVYLKILVDYFAEKRVKLITHSDLEKFKKKRLTTEKRGGGKRSITSVNRELTLLRTMLNFARQNGWIIRNPFEMGTGVISQALETKRERILTREEEARLLLACTGNIHRELLRSILICALDTGMRRGELLALRWGDVDFVSGTITLRATTTKTMKARTVGMTTRLKEELQRLDSVAPDDPTCSVFGIDDNFRRSFASVCAEAGVENFRFHDCRHTALTRMIESGMPPMQVMALSGHTQMQTFKRYINSDEQTAQRAAMALDNWRENSEPTVIGQFIN